MCAGRGKKLRRVAAFIIKRHQLLSYSTVEKQAMYYYLVLRSGRVAYALSRQSGMALAEAALVLSVIRYFVRLPLSKRQEHPLLVTQRSVIEACRV